MINADLQMLTLLAGLKGLVYLCITSPKNRHLAIINHLVFCINSYDLRHQDLQTFNFRL